jgi:hypothetical protein
MRTFTSQVSQFRSSETENMGFLEGFLAMSGGFRASIRELQELVRWNFERRPPCRRPTPSSQL